MASTDVSAIPSAPDRDAQPSHRAAVHVLVVLLPPAVLTIGLLVVSAKLHAFAVDFENAFWPAGRHVLDGQSPFPPATREALAAGTAFVYPAFAALLMAPLALLPLHVAAGLFTAVLLGSAVLTLHLLGVRDWRCYAAIFVWGPVLSAVQTANLTLLLTLGVALLWRFRDRRIVAAAVTAVLIALKLFLWPLLVWLVATRRFASGLMAAAMAVVLTFGSWAVLGFAGIGDYLPTLRLLARIEQPASYLPLAVGLKLGLGFGSARALGLLVAASVLGAAILLAWRKRDDERSFALAIVASILFSPVVWLHYYALLVVPLALLRPRYGLPWVMPLLLVLAPPRPHGPTWWAFVVVLVFAVLLAAAMGGRESRPYRWHGARSRA